GSIKDGTDGVKCAAADCHNDVLRLPESFCLQKIIEKKNNRNRHTQPGEPVAEARVDGGVGAKVVWQIHGSANVAWNGSIDAAVGIDRRGQPAIGDAQYPAPVLHRTHPRHSQVLISRRRFSKPAVIRNIDQQVRTVRRELADFARIDCLIADENTKFVSARQLTRRCNLASMKPAHFAGNALHDAMNQRKWFVFAKWHQVAFIIAEYFLSLWIDKQCTVIRSLSYMPGTEHFALPLHHARQKRMLRANRQTRRAFRKLIVLP